MSIAIEQLRYVVLGTRDLESAARFAAGELGLQPVSHGEDEISYRSDERQYSLVYAKGDPRRQAIGLELRDEATLQAATDALAARGIALSRDAALAARRNVRALAAFTTPGGLRVELVVRPQNQAWRFFPSRDAGVTGLAGLALRSTDVEADQALWTDVFGARVADWAGDAVYLGFDAAHHRLALHPAAQAGVMSAEFGVEGINQVMQQYYRLRPTPELIVHGPGRRPASDQVFLHFSGPDEVLYAFVAEGQRVDPAAPPRPRQFSGQPESFCAWGSECRIPELDGRARGSVQRPVLRGGAQRMISLRDVCYVRLGTRDLEGATRYATTILGLEVSERSRGAVYFKSDAREHTLCYVEGDVAEQAVAFEVDSRAELDAAGAELERLGHPVQRGTADQAAQRKVRDFIAFRDPTGNRIELVWRPQMGARRYHGERDAGITGFSHIGLCTTDAVRDEAFWTSVCNAKVSDRIGDAPLLRIDEVHHKIALFPSSRAGIQHINHQVESPDDVQRSYHFIRERGIPVVFGPGRHPTSSARFLYFEGPDGMIYEYSSGVRSIADELLYRERQFEFAPPGFCEWGAKPAIKEFTS